MILMWKKKYQVPENLGEAAKLFKNSDAAKKIFGNMFVNHFANTRFWEHQEYLKSRTLFDSSISNWELERYFEII
ncbi:MAG: hypothetical protein CM15mP86_01880 [Gammaproteobacteria bacterium]|nr:MAG: hypothetical protein CM15mP86_01880 [Gammaproteobacteria bacterium]